MRLCLRRSAGQANWQPPARLVLQCTVYYALDVAAMGGQLGRRNLLSNALCLAIAVAENEDLELPRPGLKPEIEPKLETGWSWLNTFLFTLGALSACHQILCFH